MNREKFADIIDVANRAGVSPATVSRAFNHPDLVKPATRRKIQKAVEDTGYIRNRAAQAIHGRRSGTVGLIVPTLDNAIFSNLIQSFSETLNGLGFTMLVATHGYDLKEEHKLLRSLLEHRIEGIGLIGLDHEDSTYTLLERRNTPAVAMWNYQADSRISCVGSDNYTAGQMAASHIVEQGHRRIGIAFPPTDGNDRAASRLRGVMDVLTEAGVDIPDHWKLRTQYSISKAKAACLDLFRGDNLPTALIAGNDVIAQGAVFAATQAGLVLPRDISITGIGDFAGSAEIVPGLTTVKVQSDEIGEKAAHLLYDLISEPDERNIIRENIDLKFIARATTGPKH
ncbi:LacI family DNA-binding transcriptional regulator [Hoeflea sp. TYP-13]|uniref:LacI family DNA-binding transcriptional regulator n=1 Tax=Hoeflea sp. TYP-13 TaxID=3230023 RepID=UPI0034C65CF8